MKTKSFDFLIQNYQALFLVFVLFGYVFFNIFPVLIDVDSQCFSVPYRFLVFVFSFIILVKNKAQLNKKFTIIFCLFWLVYAVKAAISFHFDYYESAVTKQFNEIFVRIFLVNLVPCLALLSISYSKINLKLFVYISFFLLLVSLSLNFLYTTFYTHNFNKSSGIFAAYYISSGHFGSSLVILSTYFLFFTDDNVVISKKYLISGLLLGSFAVFISAARSPLLAVIVVGLYFVVLSKKVKYLYVFLLFLCLTIFIIYVSNNFLNINNEFVQRNYVAIFEGNSSGREVFFRKAFTIINDNIFFGGRILFADGMYPHNIFLELLMSGGLILVAIFLYLFSPIYSQFKFFLNFSHSKQTVLLIFAFWLQYLILVQTSYNIHCNAEFWYFSCVVISICLKNNFNEKIKTNDGGGNPSGNN